MNTKVVVLTGAGISAESGLKTFRDSDGLWEQHRIEDVATPMAWKRNPRLVLEFYNQRRQDVLQAQPNAAHLALAMLQSLFDVSIITQNIDDLHERAGSKKVLHLHGEILKSRSSSDDSLCYPCTGDILLGDLCELGSQLRPHVVWFHEAVPMIEPAIEWVQDADILVIVGTSLQVYPAAGLITHAPLAARKYLVDPHLPVINGLPHLELIQAKASTGVPQLVKQLMNL